MSAAFWFMVAVVVTAVFAFISVVVWLGERTEEREARFRSETVNRLAESGNSDAALEYLREVDKAAAFEARTNARIAGLITLAVGVALMIFLHEIVTGTAVYLAGLIPLLVGVALLIASEFMMKPAK